MLKLLLDEHLSPRIAQQLIRLRPAAAIAALIDWEGGKLSGAPDEVVLAEAYRTRYTLVSYDQSTIVPLLKNWGEQGIPHSGVVFLDHRSFPQHDIGRMVKALVYLWDTEQKRSWTNQVIFLRAP